MNFLINKKNNLFALPLFLLCNSIQNMEPTFSKQQITSKAMLSIRNEKIVLKKTLQQISETYFPKQGPLAYSPEIINDEPNNFLACIYNEQPDSANPTFYINCLIISETFITRYKSARSKGYHPFEAAIRADNLLSEQFLQQYKGVRIDSYPTFENAIKATNASENELLKKCKKADIATSKIVILTLNESAEAFLTVCKRACINGFSAFGAAIIAKNKSLKKKKKLIQKLYFLGFKPTDKDRELATLDLWERSDEIKKSIYALLCAIQDPRSSFMILPKDIATCISRKIIALENLLP